MAETTHTTPMHAAESPAAHDAQTTHAQAWPSYLMPSEPPNIATFIQAIIDPKYRTELEEGKRPEPAEAITLGHRIVVKDGVRHEVPVFEIPINPLFSMFYALIIVLVVRRALKNASIHHPGRLQMFVEAIMGGLHRFFLNAVGQDGRPYIPYLGTLFLFIWINNVASLIPGMKSPTSSIKMTAALAIVTFIYARAQDIRASGFRGYIYHLLGSPTDAVTWAMSPLFFIIEALGEIIKPLSLALRLYGNIFGEDKLLATFLGLGMMIVGVLVKTPTPIVGVPLHLPFYFLVLLLSTIQAVVFSLLAGIYLMLMMPHKAHEEHPAAPQGAMRENL
ncbi:F0F1 ATP synthase subunit A [bacterium]|nr:F0F1 ATP synthase subunit A [bacterium]